MSPSSVTTWPPPGSISLSSASNLQSELPTCTVYSGRAIKQWDDRCVLFAKCRKLGWASLKDFEYLTLEIILAVGKTTFLPWGFQVLGNLPQNNIYIKPCEEGMCEKYILPSQSKSCFSVKK